MFCIGIFGYVGRFWVQNGPPCKKYFQVFSPFLVLSPCFFCFFLPPPVFCKFLVIWNAKSTKDVQKTYEAQRTPDQTREPRQASPTSHATSSSPPATPPASNQQGLTSCPDLPMTSSPTLPSEWAGGGSGSAGSIRPPPSGRRRVGSGPPGPWPP